MLSIIALALTLATQGSGDVAGNFSSYVAGQRWDFIVSHQDIEQGPRWLDVDDNPPLPPRVAIQAARIVLWQIMTDARTWRLASVKLQPILFPDAWIYVVEFAPPPPRPDGGIFTTMSMVVLMDGRAIVPVSSKWPAER